MGCRAINPRQTVASSYLSEPVNFGGQMMTRGAVMNELRKTAIARGHSKTEADRLADRWMQGHDLMRKRNPLFLPKSLFDSYIVRTTSGEVTVDKIQTLGGAERKAKELQRKYPCAGIEIVSEKHGTVIKAYEPTVTGKAKVKTDNTRGYLRDQKQEAKGEVKYVVYVGGEHWSTEDTEAEAKAVGQEAGKSEGKKFVIKPVSGNPERSGVPSAADAFIAGRRWYISQMKSTSKRSSANWETAFYNWLKDYSKGDYMAVHSYKNYGSPKYKIAEEMFNAFSSGVDDARDEHIRRGELSIDDRKPMIPARSQNPLTGSPSRDIPLLRREGYPQRQSAAIAMEEQRRHGNPYAGLAGGTLESGDSAFFDTFSGSIPCKVISITGRSGAPGSAQTVTVKLTAKRGAYKAGEVIESNGMRVVPRKAVHGNRIRSNYRVVVDGDKRTGRAGNPASMAPLSKWHTFYNNGRTDYRFVFGEGPNPPYYDIQASFTGRGRDDGYRVLTWRVNNAAHGTVGGKFRTKLDAYKAAKADYDSRFDSQRNPSSSDSSAAADLYQTFHGVPSDGEFDFVDTVTVPDTFAGLGALVELWVIPSCSRSNKSVKIAAPDPEKNDLHEVVTLASDPAGQQLYFVGGDQELDVKALGFSGSEIKQHMVIGVLTELTYRTQKKFNQLKTIDYFHKTGEESGHEPTLIYDPINKQMSIAGGAYKIKDVGIVD